jgi:hypothetical protein
MVGFVHALIPDKNSVERIDFDQTRSFEQRSEKWKALVEARIKEPNRSAITGIIGRARNAQQMRDRIVHAPWAGKPVQGGEDLSAKSVFNWSKPRAPFEWDLDFGKLMYVAGTLDSILIDIIEATGWVSLSAARGQNSLTTLGEALQRISHAPNPSS